MTDNETTLFNMIKENDNPEHALFVAIGVIISFLNHHESTESIPSADSREHA